jgi:DNA-binding transcriptional MerR regulator
MRAPMDKTLPEIPAKRYFTIGEVSELCGVKAYVLRYWEQEFTQLRPMKRRGNRRYYQHHEVLLIRRIRELLYEEGFTISGARNRLSETHGAAAVQAPAVLSAPQSVNGRGLAAGDLLNRQGALTVGAAVADAHAGDVGTIVHPPALSAGVLTCGPLSNGDLRKELLTIRRLLDP